jgi:hypothetical protein
MNSLSASGNIYGAGPANTATSRVRGRPASKSLTRVDEPLGPPRFICLECRGDAPASTAGDPMRTDRNAVPTIACPACGADAWVDGNAPAIQEQLVAIDAYERGQLRRPWARIAARGAIGLGATWVFAGTVGLVETAFASSASVFGAVVLTVTTMLLVGVWMATSPGYRPALDSARTRTPE